jgi:hypothetical protein
VWNQTLTPLLAVLIGLVFFGILWLRLRRACGSSYEEDMALLRRAGGSMGPDGIDLVEVEQWETTLVTLISNAIDEIGGVASMPNYTPTHQKVASGGGGEVSDPLGASASSPTTTSPAFEHLASALRYSTSVRAMVLGVPADAALGINHFMRVTDSHVYAGLMRGTDAILEEVSRAGSAEDQECLRYVLRARAGDSDKRFANGIRDCDEETGKVRPDRLNKSGEGMSLSDFVSHPNSVRAGLSEAHIVALRLYTTAAFASLNTPLRELERKIHPFPVTIKFITEAIKQLRAVSSGDGASASLRQAHDDSKDLWRGLRDMRVDEDADFLDAGGTELAPMVRTEELAHPLPYPRTHTHPDPRPSLSTYLAR